MNRKNSALSAAINAFIVISTVIIAVNGISSGAGEGQVGENMRNWGYLKAFTNLSNILAAVCAGVMLFFNIKNLTGKSEGLPRGAMLFFYTGTSALGLTFIIVVGFLGPMFELTGPGYFTMFRNDMFFFHFLNPVLCGICFVMLQRQFVFGIKDNLIAIIPTVLYSFVYAYMVVIRQSWSDFYNFTFGGHYELAPIVMIAMYAISFLIALAQRKLHNRRVEGAENS